MTSLNTVTARVATDYNPFNGISPSFGPFSSILESKIGIFLAIVWAGALAFVAYHLLVGTASLVKSRNGGYAGDLADDRQKVLLCVGVVVLLMAMPAIWAVAVKV